MPELPRKENQITKLEGAADVAPPLSITDKVESYKSYKAMSADYQFYLPFLAEILIPDFWRVFREFCAEKNLDIQQIVLSYDRPYIGLGMFDPRYRRQACDLFCFPREHWKEFRNYMASAVFHTPNGSDVLCVGFQDVKIEDAKSKKFDLEVVALSVGSDKFQAGYDMTRPFAPQVVVFQRGLQEAERLKGVIQAGDIIATVEQPKPDEDISDA